MKPTITTTTTSQIPDATPFGAVYHQRFAVQYDYPVHFTQDLFSRDNPVFVSALTRKEPNKRSRFVVFIDADVASSWPALAHDVRAYAESHAEQLQLLAPPETILGGEQVKHDPDLVTRLQHRLVDLRVDRHSYVVAIGGGAFLDMVGYVAATTHRGVRHVRVPTTVLGQNDTRVPAGGFLSPVGGVSLVDLANSIRYPSATPPAGLTNGTTIGVGRVVANGVNFGAMLRAIRGDGDSNILATPSATTMDNQEAEFKATQEVPFITGSFTNTGATNGATNPFQTVQREEVGTILKVTPQIAGEGVPPRTLYPPAP